MGVYSDQAGTPLSQMGATMPTAINATPGWQTVSLKNPVFVNSGQTVWLSWVFENNPGVRYSAGTPGRAQSTETWPSGMPASFGPSGFANYKYAIYCTSSGAVLEVPSTSVLLDEVAGANGTFNIVSNLNWSITKNADWLNVSKSNGSSNETITLTTNSVNVGLTPRTAVVTIVGQDGASKSITVTQKNQTLNANIQGTTEVFASTSTTNNQRAIPITFNEEGEINSISIYHNGGTGNLLLGVYSDMNNSPSTQLGITPKTLINTTAGWQTVELSNPIPVASGQKVWLSWLFEKNPGIRYSPGLPGRAESMADWTTGMQATFGTSTFENYNYSIFCSYKPGLISGSLGNNEIYNNISTAPNRRAISITAEEIGVIESISIYHEGGTGNVILGVYSDNNGSPSNKLGTTSSTTINSTSGWQTVVLTSPVPVNAGETIWLSWVFQNNPGIRYSVGSTGRVQSNETWPAGMPSNFGTSSSSAYKYSIYCTFLPNGKSILGNTKVYDNTSIYPNRRAISVTSEKTGTIESITIYHNGGTGNVLLGVYAENNGSPSSQMGITASTPINSSAGWQTIPLSNPVQVNAGQKLWLSWVFENNPGIRYADGMPGRVQSEDTWSGGMPANFGNSTTTNYEYSIYCTIKPGAAKKVIGNNNVYNLISNEPFLRALPVTFSESGTINSLTIYHNGGSGNIILGIYSDQTGVPSARLGVTTPTIINSNAGWQTVSLDSPVSVKAGQTVWLSWVFENNPGIRYSIGKPGRAQSTGTWSSGLPASFGSSSMADYNYSIYCSFTPNKTLLKGAEIADEAEIMDNAQEAENTKLFDGKSSNISFINEDFNQSENFVFKMYPNPTKYYVNIDFTFMPSTGTIIEIIDGQGKTIVKKQVESTSNRIDVNQLNQGVYFVRITNNRNTSVKKLIVR
jgi:hypothetical protein